MKRILIVLCVILFGISAKAQNRKISGIVKDQQNMTVIGANVKVIGHSLNTVTDFDGNFSLSIPNESVKLEVSSVGLATLVYTVGPSQDNVVIVLSESVTELKDVVVTSMGIKKQRRSLGYAVGEIKGEDLTKTKEVNIGNSLQGRVAGVNVSAPVTGPSGSSRVVIRGATSASGSNQPLYVIDGIPVDNMQQGNAGQWGGNDKGDGMSSFNPDDIASMSIMKGSAASALYGFRGSNGVILITTKKGKSGKGIGVDFSSNLTMSDAVNLLDWQDKYGAGQPNSLGVNERYPSTDQVQNNFYFAWGDRYDGTPAASIDGEIRPYKVYGKNNVENFYRKGFNFANTLALSGGNEISNFRLSLGNTKSESIMPNNDFDRTNIAFNYNANPNKKISVETNVQYILEKTKNRPYLNDAPRNAAFPVVFMSPSTDIRWLRNPFDDQGGESDLLGSNIYMTQPYFATGVDLNKDLRKRFVGSAKVNYNITDKLYAKGVIGIDDINYEYEEIEPTGIAYNPGGSIENRIENRSEINASAYLGYKTDLGENFSLDAFIGGNMQYNRFSGIKMKGNNFIIPFKYFYGNTTPERTDKLFSESAVNSLFYSADIGYKDYLFLGLTGRQDWFSTLDPANNSIFYPSVSSSFVYTEAFQLPEWMSYGKVRLGWGNVGGALPDAYALNLRYSAPDGITIIDGRPVLGINSEVVPNSKLKPYNVNTIEIGFENTFFNNKLSTDLTFYNKKTTNDIADVDISSASGFKRTKINVGEIQNKGVEFAVNTRAIKTQNFSWNIGYNIGYNDNKVLSLSEGITTKVLEGGRDGRASVVLEVGQAFGTIKAYDYLRDANGEIVLQPDGRFARGELINCGPGVAPVSMGFTNDFKYKNFTLSVLIDAKFGGHIYSATNQLGTGYGLTEQTLQGREGGVQVVGKDINGNPVNKTVSAYDYWRSYSDISSNFVYDSDFIKLRSITFTYNMPQHYFKNIGIQALSIGVSGHNLLTLYSKTPNIDPETNYSNSNAQGLERASMPLTRNVGFNLNVKF